MSWRWFEASSLCRPQMKDISKENVFFSQCYCTVPRKGVDERGGGERLDKNSLEQSRWTELRTISAGFQFVPGTPVKSSLKSLKNSELLTCSYSGWNDKYSSVLRCSS